MFSFMSQSLPSLEHQELIAPLYKKFSQELSESQYTAEINFQYSACLAVATDNSIYQQLPQLILYLRSQQDIIFISKLSLTNKYQSIKFIARGGGTGTNGQSLTPGIVVDLSKYMNRILEINIE